MNKKSLVAFTLVAFLALPRAAFALAPCAGFTDVDSASPFCGSVAWLKNRGVTQGCTATQYCPDNPVTRLSMAAFISRLGNFMPATFVDANGKVFAIMSLPQPSEPNSIDPSYALLRYQGKSILLAMHLLDPAWTYNSGTAYFQLADCSPAGKVYVSRWSRVFQRFGVIVFGTAPAVPGPRWLYATFPGAQTFTAQFQSRFEHGACVNYTSTLPLTEAEFVVDLATVWTEPFSVE